MEKKKLTVLLVLLVALIGAGTAGYQFLSGRVEPEDPLQLAAEQAAEGTENEGGQAEELVEAPDFTVYDGAGELVRLSDFKGQPVIVNFWASWCGPCKIEMPYFDAAHEAHSEEIAFLMVNLTDGSQETQAQADTFISEQGYGFPVYYDLDMDAAATYGVYSIPATLAVDAEGNIVTGYVGTMTEAQVDVLLSMLLNSELL